MVSITASTFRGLLEVLIEDNMRSLSLSEVQALIAPEVGPEGAEARTASVLVVVRDPSA